LRQAGLQVCHRTVQPSPARSANWVVLHRLANARAERRAGADRQAPSI